LPLPYSVFRPLWYHNGAHLSTVSGQFRQWIQKTSQPDDTRVRLGHIQGNLAQRVCELVRASARFCAKFCPKGRYQGERISVARMRAEIGSPWSVSSSTR